MSKRPWMSQEDDYNASTIRSVLRLMPDDMRQEVLREALAELDDEAAAALRTIVRVEEINHGVDYGI